MEYLLVGRERHELGGGGSGLGVRHDNGCLELVGLLEVGSGGISGLGLLGTAGEHHEVGLVRLQASSVQLQALDAAVPAAVVNADTDGGGNLHGNASLLKLGQGEATTGADLR